MVCASAQACSARGRARRPVSSACALEALPCSARAAMPCKMPSEAEHVEHQVRSPVVRVHVPPAGRCARSNGASVRRLVRYSQRPRASSADAAQNCRRACASPCSGRRSPPADGPVSTVPSRAPRGCAAGRMEDQVVQAVIAMHDARFRRPGRNVLRQPVDQVVRGLDAFVLGRPGTAWSSARSGARSSCPACRSRPSPTAGESTLCKAAITRFISS